MVAAEQVKAPLGRIGREEAIPVFVFDAGYDAVKLQQGLGGRMCQILVRLRAGRRFYADPSLAGPPAPTQDGRAATTTGPRWRARTREHLARPFHGARVRGRRLRSGARQGLGEPASEGEGARRPR